MVSLFLVYKIIAIWLIESLGGHVPTESVIDDFSYLKKRSQTKQWIISYQDLQCMCGEDISGVTNDSLNK